MNNDELLQLAKLCKHDIEQLNPQPLQRERQRMALAHINRIIRELEARLHSDKFTRGI